MTTLRNTINEMLRDDSGLSSVEYALLLAFIAGGIILAAGQLGGAVSTAFTAACQAINNGVACP